MSPAPSFAVTFSAGAEAVRRIEAQRKAREDRMRNALEILERIATVETLDGRDYPRFVRATAREGLGRE